MTAQKHLWKYACAGLLLFALRTSGTAQGQSQAPPAPPEASAPPEKEKAVQAPEPPPAPKQPEAADAEAKPEPRAPAESKPAAPAPEEKKPAAAAPCPDTGSKEKAPAKEYAGCVARFKTLADGYREAGAAIERWMEEASTQAGELESRERKLQQQIQDNEAATTKAKLEASKAAKARLKELSAENKGLWRELEGVRSERTKLCRELARTAAQKLKELSADIQSRLSRAKEEE